MSDALQPGKSPLEYLAEAERRFAARSNRAGCKRVWQAFLAAAAPIAAQRGLPCGNAVAFKAGFEDARDSLPNHFYTGRLSAAALLDAIEDGRSFVRQLLSLAGPPDVP